MGRGWGARAALGMAVLLVVLGGLLAYQPSLLIPLPSADAVRTRTLSPSSLLLDQRGQVLYELIDPHTGSHRPLPLAEMPLALRQAIIATEDATFYHNPGVDGGAIARAVWINLRRGEVLSGGSTITQQVARNLLLEPEQRTERTWQRKLREALLAYHLTRILGKDEILALYLNEMYFGQMAYGVEAAARVYFGKAVQELDLAECALLAGLPQAPALYDPLTYFPAAKERQGVVLGLMVKAGLISTEEAELAHQEPLHFAASPTVGGEGRWPIAAPHFCMMVREELGQLLGEETVRRGGLRVVTTLDLDLQRAAEGQVQRHLADLNAPPRSQPSHEVRNAAVVVLDPRSGAVRALVGSPDYFDAPSAGAVNGALALRQPGSAIKPLTYAAALARGFSPATMLADERTVFTTAEGVSYVPVNYDFRHHGLVSLRQALACSYNVVAVKVLDQIGLEALLQIARQTGLTSFDAGRRFGLALTLGGGEVQLLQLSAAYAALANGGWRVAPHVIERVEDAQGRVLYRTSSLPLEQVLDERVAYLITDILADPVARVPTFGEGSALELPFPAAVKTGTTNAWRDNWTVGYSTDWVTGVWVGNADGAPMVNVSGVSGAAPIWNGVMRFSHRLPPAPFPRPLGVVEAEVCAESGLLPGEACPRRKRELLLAENVPTAHCPLHATPAGEENEGVVGATHASPLQLGSMASSPLPVIISPDPHSVYVLSAALPVEMQQIEVAVACPEGSAACVGPLSVWVDERLWHTWAAPPYTALWPLAVGEHTIQARGAGADSEVVRVRVQAGE